MAHVPGVFSFRGLLPHRPGNGVSVILELDLACRVKPYCAFAGMVIIEEFIGRSEEAGFVRAVVVMSCEENSVSEGQHLAPAGLQILRGRGCCML